MFSEFSKSKKQGISYLGQISNSLYYIVYFVVWFIKCMNYKYTEIWKCIFSYSLNAFQICLHTVSMLPFTL
jgi:hypothetical protein